MNNTYGQLFNHLKLTTMKKKWFFAGAVLLMAAAAVTVHLTREQSVPFDLLSANVEALTQDENPNCPNGCLDNGNGCYCNFYFPYYKEAIW